MPHSRGSDLGRGMKARRAGVKASVHVMGGVVRRHHPNVMGRSGGVDGEAARVRDVSVLVCTKGNAAQNEESRRTRE
eukprot:423666-Pleurochrysis_carterae.AAC.1